MKIRWSIVLALVVCCAASLPGFAQGGQISGIAHIAYRASDLDKEIAFLGKLGFEESFGFTNAAGKTTEVFVKVNDRQFLEVYPRTDPSQPLGWMHVCYESPDINALVATLSARGLKPAEVRKAGAGNLISSFNDPEGRVTELTQYMPGSRHTLDQGKHLGEHRVADQFLGFSLPVPDLDAARKFYVDGLGFKAHEAPHGLFLTLPGVSGLRLLIHNAGPRAAPETLFLVSDIDKAAQQLEAAGLTVRHQGKRVVVTDPDGNDFAFVALPNR